MTTDEKKSFRITVLIFLIAIFMFASMSYYSNHYMDYVMFGAMIFYFIKFLIISKR